MMRYILCFSFFLLSSQSIAEAPQIQLANIYREGIDVHQYLVSEKLDGVRGRFDGEKLISRQGNIIKAPEWFIKDFPKTILDGELWIDRGRFEEVSGIINQENASDLDWQKIRFMVFDLPASNEVFLLRYKKLLDLVNKSNSRYLRVIEQNEISDATSLKKLLDKIVTAGGEGLMLHRKDSLYKAERNDDLLKLKTYEDAEAKVIAVIDGKGKNKGRLGALLVETPEKIRFKIGGGFSDKQRQNPPKIGSKVTYKFYGKTKGGKPRFPIFLRERSD
jgi:DNA ligase-1